MDLRAIQRRLREWQLANFTQRQLTIKECCILQMALGMNEEAGEVACHVLKGTQSIRSGENGFDKEQIADGVIDAFVFGMQLLSLLDIDVEKALSTTLDEVLNRDWIKFPSNGVDK
jgi:NTP pyrophosphatase (non-canonical NTP hydrolase)